MVNDTGESWGGDVMGAPWAKVVETGDVTGAAHARNIGYQKTRGKWVVWLDADDYWLPWFLERLVSYGEINNGVIYSDFIEDREGKLSIHHYDPFEHARVPFTMQHSGTSVLIPRWVVEKVFAKQGGWDEHIPGTEDGDFQIAMYEACACAFRVEEPLFVYRMATSTKRVKDYNNREAVMAYLDQKWSAYRKGEKLMGGCGCGGKKTANSIPSSSMTSSGNFVNFMNTQVTTEDGLQSQMVTVEYMGDIMEPFSIKSVAIPGKLYRFGNNEYNKKNVMFKEDADRLTGMLDGNGIPKYRILGAGSTPEVRDPAVFMGTAIG